MLPEGEMEWEVGAELEDTPSPLADTSLVSASPNLKSNKRKRESDNCRTPCRPKTAKTAKRLSNIHEDDHWYTEEARSAPVPLPLSVVSLFKRPVVFPKPNYDELLKNYGVQPQVFFKIGTNSNCFADNISLTPDVIARKLRGQSRRTRLDDLYESELAESGRMEELNSSPVLPRIQLKQDGTLIVYRTNRPVIFPKVTVEVVKLSESMMEKLCPHHDEGDDETISDLD